MDYVLYILLAPYLCLITATLLVLIARKRRFSSAKELFWFVGCALGFLLTNYLELMLADQGWKIFCAKLSNVFASLLGVTWLLFVFDLIGRRDWKQPRRFWPFFVPAALATIFVFTNEAHHLIWTSVRFVPVQGAIALQVTHGGLYVAFMMVIYAMILTGIVLVMLEFARSMPTHRRQLFWIILGTLIAMFFNQVYVFRIFPWLHKDYTGFGFAIASVLYTRAIFRHRFLDLSPAPRSRLFEVFQDGILVLDEEMRIVDMNGMAMRVLGLTDTDLGLPISSCALLVPLMEGFGGHRDGERREKAEMNISTEVDGKRRELVAVASQVSLEPRGRLLAMIVLHDVTERVELFEEIKTLRGIVPICASCKKVRTDKGYWESVEAYVSAHSYAEFSHGLCPECLTRLYPEHLEPEKR